MFIYEFSPPNLRPINFFLVKKELGVANIGSIRSMTHLTGN